MVGRCAILGCVNRGRNAKSKVEGEGPISFHRFPKNVELRDAWVKATLRKNWTPTPEARVCSRHFKPEYHRHFVGGRLLLTEDAVPSSYLLYVRKPKEPKPQVSFSKNSQPVLPWKYDPSTTAPQKPTRMKPVEGKQIDMNHQKASVFCAVRGCKNLKSKSDGDVLHDKFGRPVSYYQFPEDPDLRQKWIDATGRFLTPATIQTRMAICSSHFAQSCFATVGKVKLLSKDAVPTIDIRSEKRKDAKDCALGVPARKIPFQVQYYDDDPNSNPSLERLMTLGTDGKTLTRAAASSLAKVPPPPTSPSAATTISSAIGTSASTGPVIVSTTSLLPHMSQFANIQPKPLVQTTVPIITNVQTKVSPNILVNGKDTKYVIKNDLTQPVVFVKTPNKVMVMPAKSSAKEKIAHMPNASTVQVNPNFCIQVQPPMGKVPPKSKVVPSPTTKIPQCTCPTDKYFRLGSKQIRILTDKELKLRSKNAKKSRMLKALQLSRKRSDQKARYWKKQIKEMRESLERKDRAVAADAPTVKFFQEIVKQHSQPINLNGPTRKRYGRLTKKFAVQLFVASPEAYRFVRESFDKRLPRAKTIEAWCNKGKESVDQALKLGLTKEACEGALERITEDDQWNSDLDDESATSIVSSDDDEIGKIRKQVRDETNVVIDTETDHEGNLLHDVPGGLVDELISDVDSDTDEEMTFSSMCEPGLLTPSEASLVLSKSPAKSPSVKGAPGTAFKSPDKKLDTIVKVNQLDQPKLKPNVRFETFAI